MGYLGYKPADKPLTSADITDSIITSAKIVDGTIANADINSSAAIALSKLSTTGTADSTTYLRGDGAWTAVSSDYVLLASTDASSSSSISFDGYFSSTYKNYRLIYSTVKKSASTQLFLRVRKSNADQTSSNYRYAFNFVYRSSGASGADRLTGWNASSVELEYTNSNGTNARTNGFLDIFDPLNTDGWKSILNSGFNMQNDDEVDCLTGGIFYVQTGALSGISFYPGSGTITSGNFKLYGIK